MSPFETDDFLTDRPVKLRGCDCPGCALPGEHRAPKSRDQLNDYYWFCIDHVREYNRQWDYFSGMSMEQIENHIKSATVWERPSWPLGQWRIYEQNLRDKVMRDFFEDSPHEPAGPPMPKAERDALIVLELTPPVDFTAIKNQYRLLVKHHHPDANGGSTESEEKFKNINQAFTILKQLYNMEDA